MLQKIFLIAVTLRHVKPVQLFYQLWYRVKNKTVSLDRYKGYDNSPLKTIQQTHAHELVLHAGKYHGDGSFTFLNLTHQFAEGIDWNYQGYGKLWNYNLQYADYLLDESIPVNERHRLLSDLSAALLSGTVVPEPYPVSLRIINTFAFISKHEIKDGLVEQVLKRQIKYLAHNLEYHILANHLLENIFALYISAYALNDKQLFDKAERLLGSQLDEQILPDGAHYECSLMYHNIILARVLMCIDVNRNQTRWDSFSKLYSKAALMLGWAKQYAFTNGDWTPMNDATQGIAPSLQVIEEVASKLGIQTREVPLKESGYRKWKGNGYELLIDIGKIIPSYQPGHAHADMFSFGLQVNRQMVFVDTGTSTYEANERRRLERSTHAHNTVTIGLSSQSGTWSSFRVAHRADITIDTDTPDHISASHDGYMRRAGIVHQRVFARGTAETIVIEDILHGSKTEADAHFHLDHRVSVKQVTENRVELSNGVTIHFTNAGSITVEPYQQAFGFNKLCDAQKVMIRFSGRLISKIKM